LAATEWQMRATMLLPFAKLAIFPATTRHIIAKKVAYQCHPTFIFATTWKFRATIMAFNAKKVAYQCHPTI